jgi:aryl-alcohol dehydrogenase-like predicted oxidoreductase
LGTWAHGGPRKLGKFAVGWSGHDDDLAVEALVSAWELGITHWDTADVYGDGKSEELIGKVWKDVPRDEIFLASKVGWDAGEYGHYYHPQLIRERLERSLALLKVEFIDLHYLHHCDFGDQDVYLDGALEALSRLREEGKIRFIGLSDWQAEKIARLAPIVDPDVVQPYRNVVDDTYASSGLKAWVESRDVGVAFFSPLRHGLLLGKYEQPKAFPEGDHRGRVRAFRDQDLLALYRRCRKLVTARFDDHPEPVLHALVGALLHEAPGACVLLGMRNRAQVEAAASLGEALDGEEARWVASLYRGEATET